LAVIYQNLTTILMVVAVVTCVLGVVGVAMYGLDKAVGDR